MEKTLHKVVIEVGESEWRLFKVMAAQHQKTVQRLLGELAEREARAFERKQAQRLGRTKAAKQALAKARQDYGVS